MKRFEVLVAAVIVSIATNGCSGGAKSGGNATPTSMPGVANCAVEGPGLSDCGADGESCCVSPLVEGGSYSRTYKNAGDGPTGEADPATVTGFLFDKYLVTVGRFRQYVSYLTSNSGKPPANGSGKHTHLNEGKGLVSSDNPAKYEGGWDAATWNAQIAVGGAATATWNKNLQCDPTSSTWTTTPGANETLPINCLTWYEAYAFCIWDGGFLASETEWEYAAVGGSEQRQYTWGSIPPTPDYQRAIYGCYYPDGSGTCTGVQNIAPVGSAPLGVGRWGQLDLMSEIYAWNLDFTSAMYTSPCTDCAEIVPGMLRSARGTPYYAPIADMAPWNRTNGLPAYRARNYGARCARAPK